ncbi:hypothetical protein ACIQVR_41005 [Streptomyces xanthochromogenes]
MGGIWTKGCGRCGGTMQKTYETDKDGNVTGESQWVCANPSCGAME